MEIDDLRALALIEEHGSYQQAAIAGRCTRSLLRRQVQRLEKELQADLVERQGRGAVLTPAGNAALRAAPSVLQAASALQEDVHTASHDARGLLRLVAPTGIPAAPRARALLALREQNPELDVQVRELDDPTADLSAPFDLMFHFGPPPARDGWFSRVVLRAPMRLMASPSYLDVHGRPEQLDDLAAHRLMMFAAPGAPADALPLAGGDHHPVRPWVTTHNLELLASLATMEGGLAFMPVLPSLIDATASALEPVLGDVVLGGIAMRVLSPRAARVDPKIKALLDNAVRMFG